MQEIRIPPQRGEDAVDSHTNARPRRKALTLAGHRIALPRSRLLRIALGIGLVAGGMLAFLPVLGIWMLPLGIIVLSIDLAPVRRLRRRLEVWWGRSGAGETAARSWRRMRRLVGR